MPSGTPLFVEVPDLNWITEHGAWWDFCYEHVNYFTPTTLRHVLEQAGFVVQCQRVCFNGQYQWAVCHAGVGLLDRPDGEVARRALQAYAAEEEEVIERARRMVTMAAGAGPCAVWGMATKGVVFASLVDSELLTGAVDVNERKQARFAPGSGLEIDHPEWLRSLNTPTVIVMNPNYLAEIGQALAELGVPARALLGA